LAIGLLAVPGIPMATNALLPEKAWDTVEIAHQVDLFSTAGNRILLVPPAGWQVQDLGDKALLRTPGSVVLIGVYDREEREPDTVARRLMRLHRIQGISSALDGGHIASSDGTLSGQTCVAVTAEATGTCAFLADHDVVVSVLSLGSLQAPAPPVADIVGPMTRGQA
jgi:hypothetical protein